MNFNNLHELINRYEENFDMVNNKDHDEIFKWRAIKRFQDVWFSEDAKKMNFADLFNKAKSECSILIDNGMISPANGVVKLAEKIQLKLNTFLERFYLRTMVETSLFVKII